MAVAAATLPFVPGTGSSAPIKPRPPGGLEGSLGDMQPVNLPAKVSRIAHVPGTGGRQAWAIGHMQRARDDWAEDQLVFLQYSKGAGWNVYGPAKDAAGNEIKDLVLSNLAFAPDGSEGWAVGDRGSLVHWTPSEGWRAQSACDPGGPMETGCGDLAGVSLKKGASGLYGYAVGPPRSLVGGASAPTILKLNGGTWSLDSAVAPAEDFVAVATLSEASAWAVANSTTKELRIYERTGSAWERRTTGKPIFDFPAPSNEGDNVNMAALGTSVAATPDGQTIWFGGGLFPVNPVNALETADVPFTLRRRNGVFTSYCPPQYEVRNDAVSIEAVCDRPLPLSRYQVSSLSIVGDGPTAEVFAAGLGLLHFKGGDGGSWFREPDVVSYLGSVSFAAANEGWVASTGAAIGSGSAYTSETTVGHYTANPDSPNAVSWPVYAQEPLLGVSIAPNGKAIAVGRRGVGVLYTPGVTWDWIGNETAHAYQAVAWLNNNVAWAVGDRGVITRYSAGKLRAVDVGITSGGLGLKGVAFSPSGRGFAVGERGAILNYAGGTWTKDPASGLVGEDLYAVAAAGEEFVAVGAAGRVITNPNGAPGNWSRDANAETLLASGGYDLFTVAGLPDGTVVAGGVRTLIGREPGGAFSRIAPTDVSGAVLAVDIGRSQGSLRILASIALDRDKFRTRRSSLMYYDGAKWTDPGMWSRRTVLIESDAAGYPDPLFAIALDSSGLSGWAVGGTPENVRDESDTSRSEPTALIVRMDLTKDPGPLETKRPPLLPSPSGGFRFAFFSDSSCGEGPCSWTVGSGTLADEVALRIREEINVASRQPDGPRFVIFGGSMRFQGIPEEAREFRAYLQGFEIPVYAAVGVQDLFTPDVSSAFKFVPKPPPQFEQAGIAPPEEAVAAATNVYFLEAFANWLKPWGEGSRPRDIRLVPDPQGTPQVDPGKARTFYAFDYAPGGRALARFVFVDTSDLLYAKPNAASTQNPPSDQSVWMPQVVNQAINQSPPLPVIVVANAPAFNPVKNAPTPIVADGGKFETELSSGGVSALLAGFVRANARYDIAGVHTVPVYVLGTGGAPPYSADKKKVGAGHYHAWGLVDVDSSKATDSLLDPQASVQVTVFPILQSIAVHAPLGVVAEAGNILVFQGMGRALSGGVQPGDPRLSRMTYLSFPLPGRCASKDPGESDCFSPVALPYDYHWQSEDPTIAEFVGKSHIPGIPKLLNGALVPDDQSGFLCTFRPGRTHIKLISGGTQARIPITVTGGFGPCIDKPILAPPDLKEPPPIIVEAVRPLVFVTPTLPEPLVVALPPVPAPIPAPAPPASAAGARKEEEEAQYEEQKDEGENAQAWVLGSVDESEPIRAWLQMMTATAMGASTALALVLWGRRAPQSNYARWRRSPSPGEAGYRYRRNETY